MTRTMDKNPTWIVRSLPSGLPGPENFELVDRPAPAPGPGELLVRSLWLSVDPYMRARLSAARNYAAGQKTGEMMVGGGVGEVIASEDPGFQPGEIVMADDFGWQVETVIKAKGATRLDPAAAPVQTSLGVLGMPGLSAYFALLRVGRPNPGETVLISAASGAVGQVAGQICRIKGLDAVAVAGSEAKLEWCREIGYRAGINHRTSTDLVADVARACPAGVDVAMDNTAGPIHDAALLNLNTFGRIVVVGTVARADRFDEPDIGPRFLRRILVTRARIEGFLLDDFAASYAEARAELTQWYRSGLLQPREDVAHGIGAVPGALIRMLKGENFGKQLVKL
ncbi:MAG: NADP-dependent oxidoreductase [Paracoccaceae bacterium]